MSKISLQAELRRAYPAYFVVMMISLFIGLLVLVPPLYLMQVHERVYTSRNLSTLAFLTGIALFLTAVGTVLGSLRSAIASRAAYAFVDRVEATVFRAALSGPGVGSSARYVADLQIIRETMGGPLAGAVCDMLMSPLLIIVLFLIHPMLGLLGVAMTIIIVFLAVAGQLASRRLSARAQDAQAELVDFSTQLSRGADAARAMGMLPGLTKIWRHRQAEALGWQAAATRAGAPFLGTIRFLRQAQLVVVVGVGALLFVDGSLSAGGAFAALMLLTRCVGPVEIVVAGWRNLGLARKALQRLVDLTDASQDVMQRVCLPRPNGEIHIVHLSLVPKGQNRHILRDINLSIGAGQVIAIIGPSGAGKTSLLRCLAGVQDPTKGSVSIGGHAYSHWNPDELGRYIGYLPQEAELLPGTVAQNIARFTSDSASDDPLLFQAIVDAGIDDLVKSLPAGLNTRLGPRGHRLSGGERQRIALARALYGNPVLLLLDEPYSALDAKGEASLMTTISSIAASGTTIALVTHKLSMLHNCDLVLVLQGGVVQAFGQRDVITQRLLRPQSSSLRVIQGT